VLSVGPVNFHRAERGPATNRILPVILPSAAAVKTRFTLAA
jgi:hypothetical protein